MAALELTRRAFLGAAAASSFLACAGSRGRAGITGGFLGQDAAFAHRLRDVASGTPARRDEAPIVIVGGGVAGLSAAWRMARAGLGGAVLLELEPGLGGTSASATMAGLRAPLAAHYVPVPHQGQRALCELLAEAGVIDGFDAEGRARPIERHLLRATSERHFAHGHWTEGLYPRAGATAEDERQLARFDALVRELARRSDTSGKPWFSLPMAAGSVDEEVLALDQISGAQWLHAHGLDSARLAWFVEYACRDDFGTLLPETSAHALLHYFAARGSADESEPYLTWPEGNAFLVEALERRSAPLARTRALVLAIEPRADRVIVRWFDAERSELVETHAEDVVCAVPRFVARRIVRELAGESAPMNWAPWVVANVQLSSRPAERDFPLAWDNVLVGSESLGYVVATHQLDRAEPEDVWTWYRPFPAADVARSRALVLEAPWSHWRDAVLDDLARAHPDLDEHVVSIDVARFGHGMIRPEPGYLAARARGAFPWEFGRLVLAGTDLSGLALFEEAQWTGVRAAERVLARRKRAFESWL